MATKHSPRPAEYTKDPDKAFCGVRISAAEGRGFATRPAEVECDACSFRLLRWVQSHEIPVERALAMPTFPWEGA